MQKLKKKIIVWTLTNKKTLASTIVGLDSGSDSDSELVHVPKGRHCHTTFINHTCGQGFAPSCCTTFLLSSTVQESINFYQEAKIQIKWKALHEKALCPPSDLSTLKVLPETQAHLLNNRKQLFAPLLLFVLLRGKKEWLLKTLAALLGFFNMTCCDAKLVECEIASREKKKIQSPPSRVKFPLSIHFTVSSPKTAGGVILPHNCGINSIFCW